MEGLVKILFDSEMFCTFAMAKYLGFSLIKLPSLCVINNERFFSTISLNCYSSISENIFASLASLPCAPFHSYEGAGRFRLNASVEWKGLHHRTLSH